MAYFVTAAGTVSQIWRGMVTLISDRQLTVGATDILRVNSNFRRINWKTGVLSGA